MNVAAAGTGSPDPTPPAPSTRASVAAPTDLASPSHSGHDTVSVSLGQLTSAPILDLLKTVEDRVFPKGDLSVARDVESIRTSSHSATHGLYALGQAPEPVLAHRAFDVRDDAEKLLARGAHAIEMAGFHSQRIPADVDPQAVIALANQLIATGQIPNYLRAAELGRVVISWYDKSSPASVAFHAKTAARNRRASLTMRLYSIIGMLWVRVPLLVLLLGWLLSGGIVGFLMRVMDVPAYRNALPFKIWAIGFLALVVFQFVVTIRGALWPKTGASSRSRR